MLPPLSRSSRRAGALAAAVLVLYTATTAARAADSPDAESLGRIDFEAANLPPANVELDLSQRTFANLFGIGDAAVAGVAETLAASATGDHADATRLAAEQLAAVRQIIGLSGKVVREVRVRAYEKMTDDLAPRFDPQLREDNWERIVVLRKENESARVFVIHQGDAVRGVFIVAAGRGGQALVNVVCDLSPENVQQLTSAATKIGLDHGLQQGIESRFRNRHGPPPATPHPPRVPTPPKRDP